MYNIACNITYHVDIRYYSMYLQSSIFQGLHALQMYIVECMRFCDMFKEETYYLRLLLLSDWPVIIFRAYPHKWDVYIESLEGEVVRPMMRIL